jgi:dephospho-CoA kinase
LRVGLTGGIGAGKSTVSALFSKLGAVVISSDAIAQEVLDRPSVQSELIEIFTPEVVKDSKTDRKFLAEHVFLDPNLRVKLESLIHPLVRVEVEKNFSQLAPGQIGINEVPLLFEVELEANYDCIVSVLADREQRIARSVARGLTRADAVARLSVQVEDEVRIEKSDFLIENNGDLTELSLKVTEVWGQILALSKK